eukprot:CAMPEP_0181223962 /NCGR_PEP_ID=MMETSP1096-20121128/30849_1 /TAXON_ID=156174 ORGANISM="Chrysochromulina ericina, Strain CCMP281" /NCGR_SAMPLE_ID=MMETSP1096 /ASSEMBLY_ACC=CAM_ASM_000453 /LENGTH=34 /DNA_ID= /DNA_START= /DNA_END= /DNA_ORIENTATION=
MGECLMRTGTSIPSGDRGEGTDATSLEHDEGPFE